MAWPLWVIKTFRKSSCEIFYILWRKTLRELQNAAQRTSYRLLRCQNVLIKRTLAQCFFWFVIISVLSNLSFVTVWDFGVLSQLSFITTQVFQFHPNLSFSVSSQFEFLSFTRIWVVKYHHNLSFWVSS